MKAHRKILKVVILTAIPLEYQAVRQHMNNPKDHQHNGNVYETGTFQGHYHKYRVLLAEVGVGNINSALGTERTVAYFKPDIILFVGIAGRIKDVTLGDVVIGDKVYGYESGKAVAGKLLARPELGRSTPAMLERAKAELKRLAWKKRIILSSGPDIKVVMKPIAAGEKVVASTRSAIYRIIKTNYSDAIAVDMEGNGFLQALQQYRTIEALVVRGISDLLNKKSSTDAKGYQDIAADHASAFAFEVLYRFKLN